MAEAIIFIGLQGAGKTTYYKSVLAPTHALLSLDVQKTKALGMLLDACIAEGRSFAVDNTNATRAARAPYIRKAREAGYRVIACYFDVPTRTAIGRNNHRTDKRPIPVAAILKTAKQMETPTEAEGFDEIRVLGETGK